MSLEYEFGLVDQSFLVLTRALHVDEGVVDRARRLDGQELHAAHLDARAVAVEQSLQPLERALFDLLTSFGQGRLDRRLADHLAHHGFGRDLHGRFRIADVEQVHAGVLDAPEHREMDVDDVLVAGQHQAFLGHIAHRVPRAELAPGAQARSRCG